MSTDLNLARRYALHLTHCLMVCVTLFNSDDGYAVVPSDDYDGDPSRIIHEYDPFA